jgi:thiamine biosynthesis lipoprotein
MPTTAAAPDFVPVSATTASADRHVRVEEVMGTVASIDVRGARQGTDVVAAADAAIAWLHEVDARFSPFRANSEVRRIERGALAVQDATPDVRWVLARCEALRIQTGGFFDAGAGGRLDPSALVKGWAVQRGANLLQGFGLTDFCFTLGGDLVVRGGALPARSWRVGIQHPLHPGAVAMTIPARDLAVATSGAYERGDHVVDPVRGGAPDSVLSVTVVGPDLGDADAYSTAAFAMGLDGPAWTVGLDGYEAMTILADRTVLCTPGFPMDDEAAA